LRREAENVDLDPAVFERISAKLKPPTQATPIKAPASGTWKFIAGGISAVVAAAGIAFGIHSALPSPQPDPIETIQASGRGTVTFYGGIGGDEGQAYRNPIKAILLAGSDNGEITIIGWQITAVGSDEVLYSAEGSVPDETLTKLLEHGADGEYILTFRVVDEAGVVYKMFRNFLVET
jgi:hypothetical protein